MNMHRWFYVNWNWYFVELVKRKTNFENKVTHAKNLPLVFRAMLEDSRFAILQKQCEIGVYLTKM